MQNRFSRSELKVMHLAVFTMCVGIVMFFVTAKTLLLPAIRSNNFKPTTCQVVGEKIAIMQGSKGGSNKVFSECANKAYVDYPCRQISVQYDFPFIQESSKESYIDNHDIDVNHDAEKYESVSKGKGKTHRKHWLEGFEQKIELQQNAVIYFSDMDLLYNDACSYHPHCSRDLDVMAREVALYHGRVKFQGTTFTCYYDPKKPEITIMYKTFTKLSIFHSIFWPFLFEVVGGLILVVVYYWIGRMKKDFNQLKPSAQSKL